VGNKIILQLSILLLLAQPAVARDYLLDNAVRKILENDKECALLLKQVDLPGHQYDEEFESQMADRVRDLLSQVKEVNFNPLSGFGVGVVIRKNGRIAAAPRNGSIGAGEWGAPGGKLDPGESVFVAARRETREETGIEITNIKFLGVTLDTFQTPKGPKFYFSFQLSADWQSGELITREEEKTRAPWRWLHWDEIPQPHFLSLKKLREFGMRIE
jgi:8-oxo-dGTP diphosphatase